MPTREKRVDWACVVDSARLVNCLQYPDLGGRALRHGSGPRPITYRDLVGRTVLDSAGRHVGRVADLRASNVCGQLRVVGLMVGRRELLARLGLTVGGIIGHTTLPGYYIPWSDVAEVGTEIVLRVSLETLQRLEDVEMRKRP